MRGHFIQPGKQRLRGRVKRTVHGHLANDRPEVSFTTLGAPLLPARASDDQKLKGAWTNQEAVAWPSSPALGERSWDRKDAGYRSL